MDNETEVLWVNEHDWRLTRHAASRADGREISRELIATILDRPEVDMPADGRHYRPGLRLRTIENITVVCEPVHRVVVTVMHRWAV